MVDVRETKSQLLHGAGSVQPMVTRGDSGAGRCFHDKQSQRRQIEIGKQRQA